jgi:CubicO group peptidase (beta-lactamase class C family)
MRCGTEVDKRSSLLSAVSACVLALSGMDPIAASTVERGDFARNLSAFIDQLRAAQQVPPGFVVVAVHGGDTVFEQAYGARNLASR